MQYQEFVTKLSQQKLGNYPAYVLTGPEDFLKQKGIELLKSICPDFSKELTSFCADNFSPANLMGELYSLPLVPEKRLVIVQLSDEKEARELQINTLTAYLNKPSDYVTLIITTNTPIRPPLNLPLEIECRPIDDYELPIWVTNLAKSYGKSLARADAKLLLEHTGNNLVLIDEAVQKLVLFVGKRTAIETDDINKLVDSAEDIGETDNLVRYLNERRPGLAVAELERLLNQGEPVERIVGFLNWYVQKKSTVRQSEGLSRLLQTDYLVKNSILPEELALKMLVVRLAQKD